MIDNFKIIEIDKIEIYDIKKDVDVASKDLLQRYDELGRGEFIEYIIINSEQISKKFKTIKSRFSTIDWINTFKNIGFSEVGKSTDLYKDLDVGSSEVLHIDLNDECDALLVIINSLHVKFIIREDGITTFQSLRYSIRKPSLVNEQFKLIQTMFYKYSEKERNEYE